MSDLVETISELIERAAALDEPKEDTYFKLVEALSENAFLRQRIRELEAQKPEPRVVPPEAKVKLGNAGRPKKGDAPAHHPADDVVALAVELVRSEQRFRVTKDPVYWDKVLIVVGHLQVHFPSITPKDAVRLCHVIVHVGSMALRATLGMRVVLPDKVELPPPGRGARKERGRILRIVRLPDGEEIPFSDALRIVFRDKPRMTTGDVLREMEKRQWEVLPGLVDKSTVLRRTLKKDPEFRQCGPKGTYPIWRYTGD